MDNEIFIIYNLQFTLLRYCNNISFILEAVWATFLCSLVLLLNVSTFPFNSFQSLRSLLSAPRSAGLGYRGLWGSDCFFFDNNELERILWSFDAQSSIQLNELSKMLWECWYCLAGLRAALVKVYLEVFLTEAFHIAQYPFHINWNFCTRS